MTATEGGPSDSEKHAEAESKRHERQSLAGSYLERAIAELRASGSPDRLYPGIRAGTRVSPAIRGALGKRIAKGRQRESTRSAVLFALLAAEAFANQYLQTHLSGKEFEAADKLPTLDKFLLGPRLVSGESLLDRSGEPAGTLKKLCDQRSALVHPKLAKPGGGRDGPVYTPEEAARYIVAVADAAGWLLANSKPAQFDMTVVAVDQEREYFLDFGRQATEQLPEITDDPAPDLVLTIWHRWADEER
jgi:hypothetical protein